MDKLVLELRLAVCHACEEHVAALKLGGCRLIRDPSERVCIDRFEHAVRRGVCPAGKFEDLNRSIRAGRRAAE